MKKTNGIIMLTVLMLLGVLAVGKSADAASWNGKKEYQITQSGKAVYHAYLSDDGKESWIYRVDLLDKGTNVSLTFPEQVQNAPVTKIGTAFQLDDIHEAYHNVFGTTYEPWHDEDGGWYSQTNIKKIVLPDTVNTIEDACFAGLRNLTEIHLPENLERLNHYLFYNCRRLASFTIGEKGLVVSDDTVFQNCDRMKGITKADGSFTLVSGGKGIALSADKKTLIQIMPSAKKITVPSTVETIDVSAAEGTNLEQIKISKKVKKIETAAFDNAPIKKVTVDKKNKWFGTDKNCLYYRKTGTLVLAYAKKNTMTLSKKVKKIDSSVSVARRGVKKLIIPKRITLKAEWYDSFLYQQEPMKVYFQVKMPPKAGKGVLGGTMKIYVKKQYKKAYKKWMKKCGKRAKSCKLYTTK
ncbi:MAG: leucine-rich repeat domain-containing protein [Lachnospiraceae bacterium]|nr:leucine-rich repeat domain-containing protein [Lachnospiraceae bacterium]